MAGEKSNLPVVVPPAPSRMGRPKGSSPHYRPEVVEEILYRLSHGHTLISICRDRMDGTPRGKGEFPTMWTIYDWGDPSSSSCHPDFVPDFARAKIQQQRYWLEECVEIAKTTQLGIEEVREHSSKNGVTIKRAARDMLGHRALNIDTRLKVIARMNPQLWAERLQQAASSENPNEDGSNRVIIEGGLPDNEPPPPAGADPSEEPPAPEGL